MDAAVLAGGKGSRMNYRDKSLLLYKRKTFLQLVTSRLSTFDRIMVIANRDKSEYGDVNADFYRDAIPDIGPMGGIYTALTNSQSQHVFITTCDMPFIGKDQIETISRNKEYDVVVPLFRGKPEMLFALYSLRCIPQFEKLIKENRYKITGIFEDLSLKVKKVPVDDNFMSGLKNINTEEEYKKL